MRRLTMLIALAAMAATAGCESSGSNSGVVYKTPWPCVEKAADAGICQREGYRDQVYR